MVDVFISYSRANQPVVRQLAEAVKQLGYSVWWDDELPPHLSYSDVITDKIGSAKAAIVVWSQDASASEWVRAEADVARSQKKLIQTSIDGRMPPMPFNQIQFADIGDWRGEDDHPGWRKVKASLDALCGAPDGANAPPVPPPRPSAPPLSAPAAGRSSLLVPALIGLLLLAVLIVGYLLWSRGPAQQAPVEKQAAPPAAAPAPGASAVPNVSAQQPPEAPPAAAQTDATFTEGATIDDPDGFTNVRGGPSADAFVVGRVNRGEVFTTYRQDGEWWQVRTADGTIGYMARSRIRLAPASAAAPQPQAAARRPAPRPAQPAAAAPTRQAKPEGGAAPQVLRMPMNPRRYCNGPGRGTAECEQLRQRFARPLRGGYR